MKNILMLHGSSDLYGASRVMLFTANCLVESGYKVIVVLSEDGPLVVELNNIGVEVEIIKLGILRRKYFNFGGILNRIGFLTKAIRQLSFLIKNNDIDLVYSNTTAVLVGFVVARRNKIPHVWHVLEIIKKPKFLASIIGRLLYRYSDLAIMVSTQVKNSWEEILDKKVDKFKVIYNGTDYSSFLDATSTLRTELCIPEYKMLIGMIGRINHWKGQSYFLEIASRLCKLNNNLHFIMVGDVFPGYEYLYNELNDHIDRLELNSSLSNLGYRTDISNILSGLDLFILPSIQPDPLPTVVLEAMASSVPVAATAHGGAVEMVENNVTGVLIPWDDPDQAAKIIHEMLNDPALLKLMGIKGRSRVLNNFSKSSYKQNLISAISDIS